jgi:hypothetical protein
MLFSWRRDSFGFALKCAIHFSTAGRSFAVGLVRLATSGHKLNQGPSFAFAKANKGTSLVHRARRINTITRITTIVPAKP